MTPSALFFTLGGAALLLLSGYLWGIRQGRSERDQLREALEEQEEKLAQRIATPVLEAMQHQLNHILQPLSEQAQHSQVLEEELRKAMQSFSQRQADEASLKETLQEVLAPIVERERRELALSALPAHDSDDRRGLPVLLNAIATEGGFTTVLLSDEVGLPLATNNSAEDTDMFAGVSSLLVSMFDRIAESGQPTPMAVVLRDDDNQIVIHRVFRVQQERYVLTAVNKGTLLTPDALDPAVTPIEQALNRPTWST
ncbi:MAG: hypothetical protein EP343_03160 [Deltaproteobacteria bacterium]|nr:MAG: hypothetical protein EP343_03160 [Deltaproteobacteria bacterium]